VKPRHAAALAAVRGRLQAGIQTSPLFDTAAFCRDFEAALTALHDRANTLAGG
jgi:predicted O-linked N-acetylglucosamine transferase (SPINDLY family)